MGGGIACFDTARNYGEAEHRIGAWLARGGKRPLLISKAPAFVGVAIDDAPEFLRRKFGIGGIKPRPTSAHGSRLLTTGRQLRSV